MYRANTAGQFVGFVAINASTGETMTGTTGFAAFRVIDGGAQASATGTVTDKTGGQYSFALSQADTNGNDISILFTMTGMVAVEKTLIATACNPTSNAFGLVLAKTTNLTGLNDIPATAVVSNGAITTAGGKVSGVVLVDTLTAYSGNTPQTGDSFARIGVNGAGLTVLALASQIPANFTTACFASAGVFSTGALANAPSGGGGGSVNVTEWGGVDVTGMPLPTSSYTTPPNTTAIQTACTAALNAGLQLDYGTVSASPAPTVTTMTSTSVTLTATQSDAYLGMAIEFQNTSSLGRVRKIVTSHTVSGSSPIAHALVFTNADGTTSTLGPVATDTFVIG